MPSPVLILLIVLSAARVSAQSDLRALLPPPSQAPGWTVKQPPRVYGGDALFDYMDGAAEIPKGYDFKQLANEKLQRGATVLEVAVFDMGTSADAYGYYTARSFLERSPRSRDRVVSIPKLDHPARLTESIGILTLWKGRYVVILQPDDGKPDDATLLRLGGAVVARIREAGSPPALMARLPRAGLQAATERFVRGKAAFDGTIAFFPQDLFGANRGARFAAAEYTPSGATLAIAQYPSAGAASAAYEAFRSYCTINRLQVASGPYPGSFVSMDRRSKSSGLLLRGSRLALVFGKLPMVSAGNVLRMLAKSL